MNKNKILKLPGIGQLGLAYDPQGAGGHMAGLAFRTNLMAEVIRNGQPVPASKVMSRWARFWQLNSRNIDQSLIDLGSGLVTNVGVLAMANGHAFANPSGVANTVLALANNHATGTGVTAAAATDLKLQTVSTQGGQTPVAGVQTLVPSGTAPAYRTVATINYTGTEAVTEWGLHTSSTLSSTTGTPATATSATSLTATATPFTASSSTVAGQQMNIVIPGTTAVWGLILSNTTSVLTIPAWYNQSNGAAGATPGSTEAYSLRPVMWDHKVFSAINVVNGDSIQFTYTVTVTSGG